MSALSLALRQSACQRGEERLRSPRDVAGVRSIVELVACSYREQPACNQGAARTCRTSTRDSPASIDSKLPSPLPDQFTSALSKACCCS
eukprot:scaffold22387_cov37-Phaeocystis_antarctica.AAC.1